MGEVSQLKKCSVKNFIPLKLIDFQGNVRKRAQESRERTQKTGRT